MGQEDLVARFVILWLLVVCVAINLHDESKRMTVEVDDQAVNHLLAPRV